MNLERIAPDELLDVDPEPCGFCATGIRWMLCYDGQWRCRTCVNELATANGWDDLPSPLEQSKAAPAPPDVAADTTETVAVQTEFSFKRDGKAV